MQKEIEFIRHHCEMRERKALYEKIRCDKLLRENVHEVKAYDELYPAAMMRDAVSNLDASIYKVTEAIVHAYTKRFAEYVRNQLTTKYALTAFSIFGVAFRAPKLNEEHIKVEILERYK